MKWRSVAAAVILVWGGLGAQGATVTLTNNDAFGFSSFDTGLNWNDGLPPSPGNAYVVTNGFTLRTPPVTGSLVFQGDALSLGDGSTPATLTYKGTGGGTDYITVPNLVANLGVVGNGQGGSFTLSGAVSLGNGGIVFDQGGGGRTIAVAAPMSGTGPVVCLNLATNGAGTVILASNNTYAGYTLIATGALQVGTGGAEGSLGGGDVTNRGTLRWFRSDSAVLTNGISGALGSLVVRGGELTLLNSGSTNLNTTVAEAGGPVATTTLNISNSTVVTLAGGINSFNVGAVADPAAMGVVNMSGGQLVVSGELWVAAGAGNSRGIFNLSGGEVRVSSWAAIGRGASGVNNYGELNLSGGSWSNILNNNVTIGSFLGNTGVVRVAAGRMYAQNAVFVGESGYGLLFIGNSGIVDANLVTIGDRNNGAGVVYVTGGVLQARSSIGVANAAGTAGTLNLGGGEIAANAIYQVGATATVNAAGGIIRPYNANAMITLPLNLSTDTSYGGTGTVTMLAQSTDGTTNDIIITGDLSGDGALTKTGAGALLLGGLNVYTGPTTVETGYLFGTGVLFSAVTLNGGGILGPRNLQYPDATFTLLTTLAMNPGARFSALLNGTNPSLVVYGSITGSGDHAIDLLPSAQGLALGTHTLIRYGSLTTLNVTTGRLPTGVEGYFNVNGAAQTVEYVVTNLTAGAAGFVWTGATDNKWDVYGTTNWRASGSFTPAVFEEGSVAVFDDTGTNTQVSLPASVTPGRMTVSNDALPYVFSGAGLGGPAAIVKYGTNIAVLNMPGTYSGTNQILGGTVVASNATALGAINGPTLIHGGTLDVGGQNLGGEPVIVSGAGAGGLGAIVNNGPANNFGLRLVTLSGDAVVGGVNRWDIRDNNPSLDLAGYTLMKTGANYLALANGMTATNAGNIVINSGTIGFEFANSIFSGPGSIVVNPAGVLGLYQSPRLWKTNVYNGGMVRAVAGGGTNQVGAPVIIQTNTTIDTAGGDITFTNTVNGPAGFIKTNANAVMLLATNSYAGSTVIVGGSVMLGNGVDGNGSLGTGPVTNNSQLIFNRPDSHVVTNPISGSGQVLARRGTTTLQNTSITNQRLYVMDITIPAGNAILNISNAYITITSNAVRNFSVGLSTNPATTGIVNMVSGALRSTNECWIAAGPGTNGFSRGVFNLMGGDVQVASWTAVGRGDGGVGHYGELNISGGTWSNVIANNISIASFAGNTGRVTVSGGRLFAQNSIFVGEGGVGYLGISGGSVDPNLLSVAQVAGGMGRVDVSGGILSIRTYLRLGNANNSVATLFQSGGAVTAATSDTQIGSPATSYGYMRNAGGSFTTFGNFQIGATGTGIMELQGTGTVSATAGYPVVGRFAGGRGVLHVQGGSFTHDNAGTFLIVGEQGYGHLNIIATGTVTVHAARTADGLRIGHNLGTGVVVLAAGGTLVAPAVTRAAAAANIGVLSFNGGTLRANTNNAAFAANLSAIQVQPGGARIDDGGFAIAITQALSAAEGQGIVSIPVLTPGDGYKGPPFVQIVGGGTNAAALAQIDFVTGSLTNIVVTCPGNNYTSFPAISLVGGAPITAATLGTPSFAANTSGGLTKSGAGTLTLSASNGYAGETVVSNGTFALTGAGSIDNSPQITLHTGATLSVAGRTDGTLRVRGSQALRGHGTVIGNVTNEGVVAPGLSRGLLTVNGNYVQSGSLHVEIGGAMTPGTDYDQLLVAGDVTYGGTLNVSFVNGYTGTPGDVFFVVNASSGSGAFAATNLPALGAGLFWDLAYLGGAVAMLSITSAPTASGYDLYALQVTNAADRGYQQDPDGDGFANLLEYATGGNPTNADLTALMKGTRIGGLLAIRFTRNTNATDTTIFVEGSYTSTNGAGWVGVATNIGGNWGSGTNVIELPGAPADVTAYDNDPAATNRFLRIRVTRP